MMRSLTEGQEVECAVLRFSSTSQMNANICDSAPFSLVSIV
jgi:hypothetical protein